MVGPYELRGEIGAGGMGVVRRAYDPRLEREVAIKALPEALAHDSVRLARLEREARLLAAVSHPNIAAIHGLETYDGRSYLILELVDGESLAQRLARRPMRRREALSAALQIAAALEAAHERGIVHRDLKPANVMLRDDGHVKVLDFGLAKLWQEEEEAAESSQSPTLPVELTRDGAVLGTAAFMSPEQARGETVDRRADIWAFGCVTFECLTGHRAFAGATRAQILSRVLESEPDWERLPADLAPSVVRLLHRCLRKEMPERWRDMGDARLLIEEALEGGAEAVRSPSRLWRAPALALGVVIAGLLALLAWSGGRSQSTPEASAIRWELPLMPDSALAVGGRSQPFALSADGKRLVYAAEAGGEVRLYLRDLDEFEGRVVSGTEGAVNPFFSPDGRWIGFFAGDRLLKVSVGGGAPLPLCDVPLDSLGADWSREGDIVFSAYGSGLWRVSAEGGEPVPLTPPEMEQRVLQHRWPQLLPDGQGVLFTMQTLEGPRLATLPLAGGVPAIVPGVAGVARARYLPSGHLVLAQSEGLMVARFDPGRGRLLETPERVLDWGTSAPNLQVAYFAVSDTGTLVYPSEVIPTGGTLVWVDRSGGEEPLLDEFAAYEYPALSPDGHRLVYQIGSEVSSYQIWILDLRRGTRSLFTADFNVGNAVWLPSGQELVASSTRGGTWNLHRLHLDGRMSAIVPGPLEQWLGSVSGDGRWLAYYEIDPRTARDIWLLDLEREAAKPVPLVVTAANERGPKISPDGRWLAYVSDETGRDEIFVTSFPGAEGKWLVSTVGGVAPYWSPAGGELFFREEDRMMAVRLAAGDDPSPHAPQELFSGAYWQGTAGIANYTVSSDGQRFVMIKRPAETQARKLRVVVNWASELRVGAEG